MLNVRRVLALAILVAVILLGLAIWRHVQQLPVQDILEALPQDIDLALDNLHYTETQDGQKRWTVSSERAEYLRSSNLVRLTPVQVVFYDAGSFGDLTLTADHGELQEDTRQVDVRGNVVVTAGGGEELTTESLRYDEQRRELTTTAPIHYRAPRMELTGVGLLIDLEKDVLMVKNDVRMLLLPQTKDMPDEP